MGVATDTTRGVLQDFLSHFYEFLLGFSVIIKCHILLQKVQVADTYTRGQNICKKVTFLCIYITFCHRQRIPQEYATDTRKLIPDLNVQINNHHQSSLVVIYGCQHFEFVKHTYVFYLSVHCEPSYIIIPSIYLCLYWLQ